MAADDRREVVYEECAVARWRGYVSSSFVAVAADGSPVVESPSFKWRRAEPPPADGAAADAYAVLLSELEALGWERSAAGAVWYETRFRRAVAAPPARPTPSPEAAAQQPRPEPQPEPRPEPQPDPPPAAKVAPPPEREPEPQPEEEPAPEPAAAEPARDDDVQEAPPYVVQEREQRRILSWSPDPFDEQPGPTAEAPAPQAQLAEAPAPAPVQPPPARPRTRARRTSATTRRQVHFHIDAEEESLLLAAARTFGSQQKGLIAALEALQETELLLEERARLLAESERQRARLAELEALLGRSS